MSRKNNKSKTKKLVRVIPWFVAIVILLYMSLAFCISEAMYATPLFEIIRDGRAQDVLALFYPGNIVQYTTMQTLLIAIWITGIIVLLIVSFCLAGKKRELDPGTTHGSAKWLINVDEDDKKVTDAAKEYKKHMMSENFTDNIMFDNTYGISMNTRKTQRNLHTLVIGGSGAGKTRYFVKPNILQMNASYIITDPSGELFRDMGQMLMDNNYDVRVFNTFDVNASMQYNPLMYIDPENAGPDVTDLVTTLIKNTGEATGDNKYFDDATKLLLTAIILFLIEYCPKSEHDFSHVMKLVLAADVPEGQKNPQSDLDRIFEQVEAVDPDGLALSTYKSFKTTAGKTLKAVLSSTAVRLNVFNFPQIKRLTCADTVSLKTIGDEKTALFIVTPPIDNGFNFLVAMMYSQLFSKLYYHTTFECRYLLTDNDYIARPFASQEEAEHVKDLLMRQHANRNEKLLKYKYSLMTEKYEMIEVATGDVLMSELRKETVRRFIQNPAQFIVKQNTEEEQGAPFHIRMIMDEFANINEIPGFQEVLATVRKYNMSVAIILQSLSQLKKRYEKDYDPIIGNCDSFVFLGANSMDTAEHISKALGDMTIVSDSINYTYGKPGGGGGKSKAKRLLMTANEIQRMANDRQLVMLRAVDPMKIPKFKLEAHPNFKLSADYDKTKRLAIKQCFDLKKKIAKINERENIAAQEDDQAQINKDAQRSVDAWMKRPIVKNGKGETSNETSDEFFF